VLSNSPAGNCSKCQAGSFSESPASPNCTSCAKGKFQAHDGESLCHACPPDSDTSTMARTSHCDCVCNSGFRWRSDLNLSRHSRYCPVATNSAPCMRYCLMTEQNDYRLDPTSSAVMTYPILHDTAHLTCKVGRRLAAIAGCQKTMQVRCGGANGWNVKLSEACEPITCPFVASDPNVLPAVADVFFNTSLQVTCREGFKLASFNQGKPFCDESCTMQNSNVSCIPRSCRYNLTKVKGLLDVTNSLPNTLYATFLNDILTTTYPNSISLKCKRRFISTQTCTQDFSPQCQANSTFDMQSRPCVPAKCKSPI
jgi:hypothetical protein